MTDTISLTPPPHYGIQQTPPKANTDHIKHKMLDIPYASISPSQKLDIYLPDGFPAPYPVILQLHGGAFMGCDKADMQVVPMLEGLKRGYAVVATNYRLSWQAKFPALVQDVKAAVRWIRANADRIGIDAQRVAAWGGSAGGYLASMLGVSEGIAELEDKELGNPEQQCNVQAVISWYGPNDFMKMDAQLEENGLKPPDDQLHCGPNSPESLLLGHTIIEVPELVKAANPETYIRKGAPPFFLQHGTMDAVVPVQQSINFASKLASVLGRDKVMLELLQGAEHADPMFETPENVKKVLDFLDGHFKKG
ncbi:MAG: alpha/beta hydrolase [Anaerolineales bacterium]|nr:MAG: alpha/beta hydrolase [Anaerolineales bacterium]